MLVTFTCLLFSSGVLHRVSDGPLTSCLQPAVSSLLFTHWWFPLWLGSASRQLCGSELLTESGRWLELQYLFQRLFIKLQLHSAVCHLCTLHPSLPLWVSPPGPVLHPPTHCPPLCSVKGLYLPVIWLLYPSLAAWQSVKSRAECRAECLGAVVGYCGCSVAPPHVEVLTFKCYLLSCRENKSPSLKYDWTVMYNRKHFSHFKLISTSFFVFYLFIIYFRKN